MDHVIKPNLDLSVHFLFIIFFEFATDRYQPANKLIFLHFDLREIFFIWFYYALEISFSAVYFIVMDDIHS